MNLRPNCNEDYETALEEIEALWEAEPGTPEADRLDILVMLVEAYEAEHYPILDPEPNRVDSSCDGGAWPETA
ncbi:MAG: hypothetical protein U0350_11630 [Caldilineaceae bacterium]